MKRLFTIILIMITVWGYSQSCKYCPGVLLGNTYKQVERLYEAHQRQYILIEKNDSTLSYLNKEGFIASYTFKYYEGTKYCTTSSVLLDCMSGEELIGTHRNNWRYINDSVWLYDTVNYDIPITVTLTYVDDKMLFTYKYIP